MLLPPFEVVEPTTRKALFKALREKSKRIRIVAGGTDLIPDLKRAFDRENRFPSYPPLRPGPRPEKLISIARIKAFRRILFPRTGAARIGTLVTMAEILDHPKVPRNLGALADGAGVVGTPQVRNRATLGGNLCNARPCADTAPAVVALSARLEIESGVGGRRMVKAEDFFTGPGETLIESNEILTAVHFPARTGVFGSAYEKLGTRKAGEIALVSSAAFVALNEGVVEEARIALGSVGPVPLLAEEAQGTLIGRQAEDPVLLQAARSAAKEARPIDDFRASAAYRRRMVEVLTFRALRRAVERAQGTHSPGASGA
ncbi:MAG: FAD binding domain-containing protein [Planctomycetota bacterium]|jgi:carbon-monoxide dehydrogenase medium subunit